MQVDIFEPTVPIVLESVRMPDVTTSPRLTSLSHGAGCACKLSLEELKAVLGGLPTGMHPDLLVGTEHGDDGAVWRRPTGRALVATTDFFTPIVDDPGTWGRVAATNAVSDVYAMGGTPLFALNLVGWPRDLPADLLGEVLTGAAEVADAAGYVIAGGHTIDSAEPFFGQAVIGEVDEDAMLANSGGHPGDVLVLTKPLGTGIVTTACKRSDPADIEGDTPLATAYRAAVASMTLLNDAAAEAAHAAGARAATDVTGFGLLGHLHRMALASGTAATVHAGRVPILPGVVELREAGFVPGGTARNADQAALYLAGEVARDELLLLADAQTSGGLLIACQPDAGDQAVSSLVAQGHVAAVVGELTEGKPGSVVVTD
jgi:selenide,water dikinase